MNKITPIATALSISQISTEFGVTRETAARRLRDADIEPCGKRGGHPVYRLRDAIAAVLQLTNDQVDPEQLDPFKRHAFYKAERERRQLEVDAGHLIPADEVESERARVLKVVTAGFETLPDVCERDLGLPPPVIAKIEALCDQRREEVYAALIAEDGADDEKKLRVGA